MYQFHYDYILPKYQNKQQLLFTDTDSLCYHIQTEDLYKDMKGDNHLFDMSGYNMDGYRSCDIIQIKKSLVNSKMKQMEFL